MPQWPQRYSLRSFLPLLTWLIGAIYGVVCVTACLIGLILSSWIQFSMWGMTLLFAVLMLLKDIVHDIAGIRAGTIVLPCFKTKKKEEQIALVALATTSYGATNNQTTPASSQKFEGLLSCWRTEFVLNFFRSLCKRWKWEFSEGYCCWKWRIEKRTIKKKYFREKSTPFEP